MDSWSWIEWLDRLERVLRAARQDVKGFARAGSANLCAALERSRRQLGALAAELPTLDAKVLTAAGEEPDDTRVAGLADAIATSIARLDELANSTAVEERGGRERSLAAADAALREAEYQAALLVRPRRRRA